MSSTVSHDRVFDLAFDQLMGIEGGRSDRANDRGGDTRFGLSSRYNPGVDLDTLTVEGARAIYNAKYWTALKLPMLPPKWAFAVFFGVVVSGRNAIRSMQRALGVAADGRIGPVTAGAAHRADTLDAISHYLSWRCIHYHEIVMADPSQTEFLRGWFRREVLVQQHLLTIQELMT